MKPVSDETVLTQLRWRYATKKFDPARKISPEDWRTLEQAVILSPSSYGLQPWKFVVVTDQAVKEKLVPISWGQRQVADASHTVVFAVRKGLNAADVDKYLARIAQVRNTTVEAQAGFRKMMLGSIEGAAKAGHLDQWMTHQVYIALGQYMAAAAMLGIDTCPMEGIEPAKYDEVLGLAGTGYATVVACPAGYRAADDAYARLPKVRFAAEDVIIRR
jgi:nitroreductase